MSEERKNVFGERTKKRHKTPTLKNSQRNEHKTVLTYKLRSILPLCSMPDAGWGLCFGTTTTTNTGDAVSDEDDEQTQKKVNTVTTTPRVFSESTITSNCKHLFFLVAV